MLVMVEKGFRDSQHQPNSRLRIETDRSSSVFCGSGLLDRVCAYACDGVWLVGQVRSPWTKPLGPVL